MEILHASLQVDSSRLSGDTTDQAVLLVYEQSLTGLADLLAPREAVETPDAALAGAFSAVVPVFAVVEEAL